MSLSFRRFGEITKSQDNADGTITVFGIASTGARDAVGELIEPDAMRKALPEFTRFPALREMHGPNAAGRVTEAYVDENGATQIAALVVDPVAISKVKHGVYAAFSVGGKVLERDNTDRTIIKGIRLVEISLVDSPCNPDATLTMWKSDMSDYTPSSDEVVAKAKALAQAAGTKRYKDYVYEAAQLLKAEAVAQAEDERDEQELADVAKADEPVQEAASEAVEAPESAETQEEAAEVAANDEDAEKAAVADPVTALGAALEKARASAAPVADVAPEGPSLEDYAKALTQIGERFADTPELAKGLRGIMSLAGAIYNVVAVQAEIAREAADEGDSSPVPAQVIDGIKTLCDALVAAAQEETAELLADLAEAGLEEEVTDWDDFAYAAPIVDFVKADEALMAKAGARNSKADGERIQSMHNTAVELGAQCATGDNGESTKAAELAAENERLAKALADAAPQVEELTKAFTDQIGALRETIGDLTKRLEQVESEPAAPKAATGVLRTVTKAEDVSPSTAEAHNASTGGLSPEDFRKALDALPEAERGEILLRIALKNPGIISPARTAA